MIVSGQSVLELSGYGTATRRKNKLAKFVPSSVADVRSPHIPISLPEDFRRVSAVIDVDVVPASQRRVRLMKSGVDASKPLGFYIRDGTSIRVTPSGVEKVPGIFISRLVPGGIAESTGLLAVNDEVLEVNGIEVAGKTLDQVTDMMVANSSNMIITVKPANQSNNIRRGGPGLQVQGSTFGSGSQKSSGSYRSAASGDSLNDALVENDEEDEVTEHVSSMTAVLAVNSNGMAQNAQNSSGRKQQKTAEVLTNSDDLSIAKTEGSSSQQKVRGSSSDTSRETDSLSGDMKVRSNRGSSRSARSSENYPDHGDGSCQDATLPVSKSGMEDTGSEINLPKGANNNEVNSASGVKVVFTPVEDL